MPSSVYSFTSGSCLSWITCHSFGIKDKIHIHLCCVSVQIILQQGVWWNPHLWWGAHVGWLMKSTFLEWVMKPTSWWGGVGWVVEIYIMVRGVMKSTSWWGDMGDEIHIHGGVEWVMKSTSWWVMKSTSWWRGMGHKIHIYSGVGDQTISIDCHCKNFNNSLILSCPHIKHLHEVSKLGLQAVKRQLT